jgi:hypothetical protein
MIYLTLIIIALLALNAWSSYHMNQERLMYLKEIEKLLKITKAKDLNEITANESLDKINDLDHIPPDTAEVSVDDEDIFDKAIKAQLEGQNERIPGSTEEEQDFT